MRLVYFDESGNSGDNLADERQPVFVLSGLVIRAEEWEAVEKDLNDSRAALFSDKIVPTRFEVHAVDLTSPKKDNFFFSQTPEDRIRLYIEWMRIAERRKLKVFYKAIVKQRYSRWLMEALGPKAKINPQVAAFVFLTQVINEYLAALKPPSLGIFISDENREVVTDIEQAIRILRLDSSRLRPSQIIEKGFFIESRKSLLLQLCDLCTYAVKKREEEKIGKPLRPITRSIAALVDPLIYRRREAMMDILAWLKMQYATDGNKTSS